VLVANPKLPVNTAAELVVLASGSPTSWRIRWASAAATICRAPCSPRPPASRSRTRP